MNRGFSIWIFPGWWYVDLGILNESHAFQPNIILQVSVPKKDPPPLSCFQGQVYAKPLRGKTHDFLHNLRDKP